ncbi:hypothetical protein [Streptomyces sp. NPDC060322]|uniref:hypothetical protein n=1 Tax=Streptomyces sp. NPDC060322 TaxID=3347097 RepID=UPI003656C90A
MLAPEVLERITVRRARFGLPGASQVAGRAVMLVPHISPEMQEGMLPPDYQRILSIVGQAGGPVTARQVGESPPAPQSARCLAWGRRIRPAQRRSPSPRPRRPRRPRMRGIASSKGMS